MLAFTWVFKDNGAVPLASECHGECHGENCGKKISNTWFVYGFVSFACCFTLGLVLELVDLTALSDIYFKFYFGTDILGHAQTSTEVCGTFVPRLFAIWIPIATTSLLHGMGQASKCDCSGPMTMP